MEEIRLLKNMYNENILYHFDPCSFSCFLITLIGYEEENIFISNRDFQIYEKEKGKKKRICKEQKRKEKEEDKDKSLSKILMIKIQRKSSYGLL